MVVVAELKVVVAVTVKVVKVGVLVKVIWVEVPINTFCPPLMERLEDDTVKDPRVVVPMPPLVTPSTPDTSLDPKAIAPLNKPPPDVERTGKALVKLLMVVEPLAAMVKKEAPDEDAMTTGLVEPEPCKAKVATGEEVPTPTLPPLKMAA